MGKIKPPPGDLSGPEEREGSRLLAVEKERIREVKTLEGRRSPSAGLEWAAIPVTIAPLYLAQLKPAQIFKRKEGGWVIERNRGTSGHVKGYSA